MFKENEVKKIFSVNLLRLRSERGLTQEELGSYVGVNKATISEWESAKKLPNAGNMEKLSNYFDIPKSALFAEGNDRFLSYGEMLNIPIVGRISCGNGVIAYEDIEGYEPTPREWVNGDDYFYLRAKGNSMKNARIQEGDLLLIRKQSDIEDGEIAAVLIEGNAVLKRVYKRSNTVVLQSENPDYPPIICTDNDCINILGKLKRTVIVY